MDKTFTLSQRFKIIAGAMVLIGIIALALGFMTNAKEAWANLLLNNYYFLSLSIGGAFFLSLQYITQSGWSAMFRRVPEAMSYYFPVAALFALVMLLGMHHLYEWSRPEAVVSDPVIAHKAPYLNLPFFVIRMFVFFGLWILMSNLLRKASLKEDLEGGLNGFNKMEQLSKIFIFIIGLSFSFTTFDWIMSLDVHWFSNIFALKGFVNAFYHGVAMLILIVILLNKQGYFPELNDSHLLDFSRYLFMLSIIWGYFWFSQFMLIWYGNIPEETAYYAHQWRGGFLTIFYVNIVVNWLIPFSVLLSRKMDRNIQVVKYVCILLLIGFWIDLYTMIFPGTAGPTLGFVEIGSFIGFAGLFALVVGYGLTKANIIPRNHPYIEESLYHKVEQ
ncbi:MAG: quinol:cytochrome C oxidoreductase [Bacteroidota bacterium]